VVENAEVGFFGIGCGEQARQKWGLAVAVKHDQLRIRRGIAIKQHRGVLTFLLDFLLVGVAGSGRRGALRPCSADAPISNSHTRTRGRANVHWWFVAF
jgi:hypothetical protein